MKKTLVALAIAGAFTGVAQAQSSVTLYGIVDVGLQRTDPKRGTATDVAATTGVVAGHLAGNRWGLRGREDLGGGLSAIFQIESGFALDTGTTLQSGTNAGSRLFGRQAYAGLSGGFGGLVLGRIATFSSGTGAFDKFGGLDPFRTGYGTHGWQATFSSANAYRFDNTVAYVSPMLGGFSFGVGKTFRIDGSEVAGGSSNNNNGIIGYLNFGAGPFYGVVTYDRVKLGEVATDPTQKHLQVGASWDAKVVKVSAAYAKEDKQFALQATTQQPAGTDATAWAVGVVVPVAAHRLMASYQKRDVDAIGASPDGDRKVWALGYEYSLSRRTTFYASYGDVKDNGSLKTATSGGSKQATVGLNHTF